jgi:hypothetical protein
MHFGAYYPFGLAGMKACRFAIVSDLPNRELSRRFHVLPSQSIFWI